MTTTIRVQAANHPALIVAVDRHPIGVAPNGDILLSDIRTELGLHEVGDPVFYYHSTTSRTIEVVDLEYDDPRVAKWKAIKAGDPWTIDKPSEAPPVDP